MRVEAEAPTVVSGLRRMPLDALPAEAPLVAPGDSVTLLLRKQFRDLQTLVANDEDSSEAVAAAVQHVPGALLSRPDVVSQLTERPASCAVRRIVRDLVDRRRAEESQHLLSIPLRGNVRACPRGRVEGDMEWH